MQAYRRPTVQILLCKARSRTEAQVFRSELLKSPVRTAHGVSQAGRSLDKKPASQKPVLWPQFAHTWRALHTEGQPHSPLAGLLFHLGDASEENRSSSSRPQVRISTVLLLSDIGVPMSINPITEHRCYPNFTKA